MQGRDRELSVSLRLVAVLFVLRMPAGIAGGAEIGIIERFVRVLRLGDYVGIADVVRPYRLKRNLQDSSLVVVRALWHIRKSSRQSPAPPIWIIAQVSSCGIQAERRWEDCHILPSCPTWPCGRPWHHPVQSERRWREPRPQYRDRTGKRQNRPQ